MNEILLSILLALFIPSVIIVVFGIVASILQYFENKKNDFENKKNAKEVTRK